MEKKDYRLAAILYTDIAGFSKMMEKNEALTLELLNAHNRIVEDVVAAKGGKVIKTIGDAFLLDFKNTVDALQSAMDIQYRLYEYNREHPDLPLLVRIGLHLGDIYFYENDALGEGINIAARLQSIAHPGCICMSGDVYNHVLNKVEFKADRLGRVSLKNISKEIHAYEIATPNVEFDANRNERTILMPDAAEEKTAAPIPKAQVDSDRAADIKRRILLDIKAAGRRLGADQMRVRYGSEGPAAEAVIAEMESKGLLLREAPNGTGEAAPNTTPKPAAPADDIVKAVTDIEYRIEDEVRRGIDAALAARRAHRESRETRHAGAPRAGTREDLRGDGRWERKLESSSFRTKADGLEDFDAYCRRVEKEARSSKAGFVGHLIPFVAVNAGLMALNAAVSPSFPWAIFPFGGWGIGLLEHYASVLRRSDRARELDRLPRLEAEQLAVFKRLQKKKDSMWLHLASTLSTSAFLGAVNLVVSPNFLWFLFPAAAMGIGLVSHAASFAGKKAELERELLDSLGLSGSWPRAMAKMPASLKEEPAEYGPYRPLVEEARALRGTLATLIGEHGKKRKARGGQDGAEMVDADLLPTVDSYVEQVALLAKKTLEADRIIEMIPMEALRSDKSAVLAKLNDAAPGGLRKEYEKSLAELERQETSYQELSDQREVLELRLRSSVNTLKQLRIDLARLSGMAAGGEDAAVNALRGKTQELNRYLSDLRAGYEELESLEVGTLPEAPTQKPE
jgi:class 3 adenylate cyclase